MYTLGTSQLRWIHDQTQLPILNNKLVGFVGLATDRTATDPAIGLNQWTVFIDITNAPTTVTVFGTIQVNGQWIWDVDNTAVINDPTLLLQYIKTASGWTQSIIAVQRGDTAAMDTALRADGVLYYNKQNQTLYVYNGSIGMWQNVGGTGDSGLNSVVGTIFGWAGTLPLPVGFLRCDGTEHLIADYPQLFAMIGYTYGGTGIRFALPNQDNSVILAQI